MSAARPCLLSAAPSPASRAVAAGTSRSTAKDSAKPARSARELPPTQPPAPTEDTLTTLAERLEEANGRIADAVKFLTKALQRMGDASPGYPSGHTAASSGPDADVHLTQPERFTSTLKDEALKDYAKLIRAVRLHEQTACDIYGITSKWGVTKDPKDLNVADPEDDMWCQSCLRIRHLSPRRAQGGVNCDWCATTLRALNQTRADKGLKAMDGLPTQALRAHAEGRRVYQKDLERWAAIGDIRSERQSNRKRKNRRTKAA